jgi:hypothetical protein
MGYFLDRFVSGPIQQPVIVRWCPRLGCCPAVGAGFSRSGYALAWLALFKASKLWGFSQMANTPPTVSARQLWDLLKDLVDRVALRRRAKSDSSNQQTVDNRQPSGVDLDWLTLVSQSLGHCATSSQKDRCRELAPATR